jgi:diketogulonate reductase-like aldo/keto reductase
MQAPKIQIPKPTFMYGTAWKEDRTSELTLMAIRAGCRAIDTANQRKHYFEAAVGEALQKAYAAGLVRREDLFLQTKFTYQRGQDHRLPYEPSAPLNVQVEQSFASSKKHLETEVIDSYVLHGPSTGHGLTDDDRVVWRTMETLHQNKNVRYLGLSNVSLSQLKQFYTDAQIKPSFVQNRCFAVTHWDYDIREFCFEHGIIYQGFSLLTANVEYLGHKDISALAKRKDCTIAQLVFRFAQQVGMLPLTGTTNPEHLKSDLACDKINLTDSELECIENIAASR